MAKTNDNECYAFMNDPHMWEVTRQCTGCGEYDYDYEPPAEAPQVAASIELATLLNEAVGHLNDPSRFWGNDLSEEFFERVRVTTGGSDTPAS